MNAWMFQILQYSSLVGLLLVGTGLIAFVWAAIRNGQINADRNLAKSLGEENAHLIKKTNYLQQIIQHYQVIIDNHGHTLQDTQRQINNLSAEIGKLYTELGKVKQPIMEKTHPPRPQPVEIKSDETANLPTQQPILNKKPSNITNKYGSDGLDGILDQASKSL